RQFQGGRFVEQRANPLGECRTWHASPIRATAGAGPQLPPSHRRAANVAGESPHRVRVIEPARFGQDDVVTTAAPRRSRNSRTSAPRSSPRERIMQRNTNVETSVSDQPEKPAKQPRFRLVRLEESIRVTGGMNCANGSGGSIDPLICTA